MIEPMRVEKILDKYTLVIGGPYQALHGVSEGNELAVIHVVPGGLPNGMPLVMSKARVVVRDHLGEYIIADAQTREKQVLPALSILGLRSVETRSPLNVDSSSLSGNPASAPVRVGDLVILASDMREYVKQLATQKDNG